ncbi:MAG TPA: immunoglobulin domain-containing protein [Verrucomicrobiae bacterium]|nr:immunoglobulin domain-containing protein [Verrucomicrobiae bacterium]
MRKSIGTKAGIRSFAGLCLVCCSLLFPAFSGWSRPFGGFLCVSNFNFNGNNTLVDSFNSSDPTQSVWQTNRSYNGHYYGTYTSTLRTADVTVGAGGSIANVGNAFIYGSVDTAPGGAVSVQKNGSVGDLAWVDGGNFGIQPGHQYDDMNMVFSDVVLPTPQNVWYSNWLSLPRLSTGTNILGATYHYVITNIVGKPGTPTNKIYYAISSLMNGDGLFIYASNAVLYVTNGISMKTGDQITLSTNGSVEIYSGADVNTGYGLINNFTQYAPALKIYGLPGCFSMTYGANRPLTAWLYAPEASVLFNSGGPITYDVIGAVTCHDVLVNGRYNFHFDAVFSTNLPTPPSVYSSPKNQIVQAGSNATFRVCAFGDLPLYYQWLLNQTNPVAGDTNLSTLVLADVQLSDAGNYSVLVTNLYGSVTSAPASLVVYTDATPTMSIDSGSTNGQFQFDISGVTGLNYSVQASTNLVDWVPLGTNVSPFSFVDTNAVLFPQRFYRSVFTP